MEGEGEGGGGGCIKRRGNAYTRLMIMELTRMVGRKGCVKTKQDGDITEQPIPTGQQSSKGAGNKK